MNPFDLPGPQFLAFFAACIGILACALLILFHLSRERAGPRIDPRDPYLIAYLRGGRLEALGTAIVSLLDRGLLRLTGDELETVDHAKSVRIARRRIERAILDGCRTARPLDSVFEALGVSEDTGWVDEYERLLTRAHLVPDDDDMRKCGRGFIASACLLWGIAFTKMTIAFSRGRHNVLYLIGLALGGTVFFYALTHARCTPEGRAALRGLKAQFRSLPRRAREIRPGGHTSELAFLAAVFGLGAVPAAVFPFAPTVRRRRLAAGAGDSWSGWGGGCGGGCGGGGCGGGCGGCGG